MPENDDVIERDVVLIEPDLSGFRRKLERKIAREMAGAKIEIPVYLKERQEADNYVAGLRAKYAQQTMARVRNLNEKVQQAQDQARQHELKQERSFQETLDRLHRRAEAVNLQRTRSYEEQRLHVVRAAEERAYGMVEKAERDRSRVVEREEARRKRARDEAFRDLNKYRKGPPIINYGGAGIRPLNLLYGSIAALTPALFAMAANAVQASTSLVALGSAGIGAALGVGALVTAFQGIGDAWKLRQTVQNEALKLDANAAKKSVQNAAKEKSAADRVADALGEYRTALREEKQAQDGVHKARVEAARDLDNLRQKVRDLNNEYKANSLTVREARENERSVNRNFFATATQRLRAHQDTLDARTRLQDTALERRQAREDLAESLKKGVDKADKVVTARDTLTDAKRRRQRAGRALRRARTGDDTVSAITADPTSSAAAQLEDKLKKMAPAARAIYHWFDKNYDRMLGIQRIIAQRTLPGFYQFLTAIDKPVRGKSTIQVFADAMGELGGLAGKYTGLLGKFSQSPLFRSSFAKIQTNNAKGFDTLGAAALKFLKPVSRILAAASPLFPRMAKGLSGWVDTFDKFIARSEKNGSLGKWFEDAYQSGRKWIGIAGNLLRFLKNIFNLSLPTGASLVDKLQQFTDSIADWSESPTGVRQITKFFEYFRDLPYGKIRDFFTQGVIWFTAVRAASWAHANPFFTALAIFAKSHPDAAIGLMTAVSQMVTGVAGIIAANPTVATVLLGLFSANRGLKTIGLGLSIPGLKNLPGRIRDMLTSKFKVLDKVFGGGATTGTMTVHAGVVNVYGGVGKGGATTVVGGTGKGSGGKAIAANLGLTAGLALGSYLASTIETDGMSSFQKGMVSALQGGLSGAAIGSMFGPIGTAAGAVIGATTGAYLQRLAELRTTQGAEAYAMQNLQGDVQRYGPLGQPVNNPSVVKRKFVEEYIAARKKSVDAAVAAEKAAKGEAAAEQLRQRETRKSVDVLSTMLQQYGWTKDKADAYGRAIYDLNGLTEAQRIANLNAQTELKNTSRDLEGLTGKAKTAAAEAKILASRLGELDGTRTITVTIDGNETVFKNLETALIYQRLLETGQPATQGNIAKQRAAFDKQNRTANMADGGRVRGFSPHARADNIPAWLTANEYVQPVDAVKHYGTSFMDAIRDKRLPRFADGGQVWPMKVTWPPHMADVVNPLAGLTGVASGSEAVAEIAEATARRMGATTKQLISLMAAGLVESGMRNLNYGDRDSVGFLQQRPSQGWGTVKQLMNPAYATRKFIQAARRINDRGMSPGQLAQAVQRSATPWAYPLRENDAIAVLNRNAPFVNVEGGGGGFGGGAGATRGTLVAFGRMLQRMGYDVSEHPLFGGVHGGHVKDSWHYRSGAIDVNRGAGTSAREQAYLRRIVPMATRLGLHTIFMSKGHYDHAHFDIGARKYDSGGVLPPGYTLAFNGTGRNETVRTDSQERALSGPMRLHPADIRALATALGGQGISMDGRKVAEVTNRYNYVPAGV